MAEVTSPRELFEEVEDAREVLVLSYTLSLEYFERFVLPEARALGALVTCVSDASMTQSDPILVTRAGIQYLDSRGVCQNGAFHPKLLVIAGTQRATVAVGSGNLTKSGWAGNAEIWTVLRCNQGESGTPIGVRQVAAFLRAFEQGPVKLGDHCHDAMERVAELLEGFPEHESAGPRILHSLEEPILEQLPEGPVDELVIHSPYFDHKLEGLRTLIDRLSPADWTVFVRPDTDVDGLALEDFARSNGGRVAWGYAVSTESDEDEPDQRAWHGKLVEWRMNDRIWTLTGSPNVTAPALLRTATHGNCELAVLAETASSLAPIEGEAPQQGASVLSFVTREGEAARAGPQLLSAFASKEGVELLMTEPLKQTAKLQVFDRESEQWRDLLNVAADGEMLKLSAGAALVGRAIRLLLPGDLPTNEIFVADALRVQTRRDKPVGSVRRPPADLVRHGLGDRLLEDLEKLRPHLIRAGAILVTKDPKADDAEEGPNPEGLRAKEGTTVDQFLAECDPVMGRRSTEYALLIPPIPGSSPRSSGDEYGSNEDETDPPEEESPEAADPEESLGDALASAPPEERKRFRSFLERLVERESDLPLIARSWAMRAVIDSLREHLWPIEEWEEMLTRALAGAGAPSPDANEHERSAAATCAAVGLTLLELRTTPGVTNEASMRFAEASAAVSHLLSHADLQESSELTSGLPVRLKRAIDAERIEAAIEHVLRPDTGVERVVRLLKSEEMVTARAATPGTVEITSVLPDVPEPILFAALRYFEGDGALVIRGFTANGLRVAVVWLAPVLAIERSSDERSWGRSWRLTPGSGPSALDALELPPPHRTWSSRSGRPVEVQNLFSERDELPR